MTYTYPGTNLHPSHIDANGLNHFKKLARQLKKSSGIKFSQALENVSRDHGFKNWNNALKFAEINEKKSVGTSSPESKKPVQKNMKIYNSHGSWNYRWFPYVILYYCLESKRRSFVGG